MAEERTSWGSLTGLQKIALGLGIPASAAILYILYCRYREDQEEQIPFVGEEEIESMLKVPKEAVKIIVGRQGAMLNQLRKDTQARINIDLEESGEEQLIRICGFPVQVCKAKAAIHQILAESLPMTEKIHVPNRAVGRIIGRGGDTVRAICRSTGAKINCEREGEGALSLTRLITISGTRKEVQAAKELIKEKLLEDEAFRNKLSQLALSRSQRKQALGTRREAAGGNQEKLPSSWMPDLGYLQEAGDAIPEYHSGDPQELRKTAECASNSEFNIHTKGHLEVYISASENPNHFWVQIIGKQALRLDKLIQEMTQYYESNKGSVLETQNVHVGDIVAVFYPNDSSWYRAQVLGTLDNGNLDLYYVDFGDNGEVPPEKLRLLRADFLSLPFQALECSLAGVAPAGGRWEEAALDEFDRLTHCAKWKPVYCKIANYVPLGTGVRPHIRLFKPTNGQYVDVGEELIRLGYAVQKLPDEDAAALCEIPKNLGNPAEMSLEDLLDTQEMPHSLSCPNLSEIASRAEGEDLFLLETSLTP